MYPAFPVQGVALLMRNHLDGGKILVTAKVIPAPVNCYPDNKLLSAAYAVTRLRNKMDEESDLGFLFNNDHLPLFTYD